MEPWAERPVGPPVPRFRVHRPFADILPFNWPWQGRDSRARSDFWRCHAKDALAVGHEWLHIGSIMEPPPDEATMPVNLSIKNVPDEMAEQLRRRARQSHRSLQGELMAILEASVHGPEPLTPLEVLEIVRGLGMTTEEDSVEMIRRDRDGR
jgi:plasmid stability protein